VHTRATRKIDPRGGRLAALAVLALALFGGAACSTHDTPVSAGTWVVGDDDPVWAPADSAIAFHRDEPSTLGPPGIYVVSLDAQGAPTGTRLVHPETNGRLSHYRWSPDGTRFVALEESYKLGVLDLATDTWHLPIDPHNEIESADWSPDGVFIAYARYLIDESFPPESTGLHVLDLATGVDRAVAPGTETFGARDIRWSPADSLIAFTERDAFVIRPDGTGARRVATAGGPELTSLDWIDGGACVLALRQPAGDRPRTIVADVRTGGQAPWSWTLPFQHDVARDGRRMVAMEFVPYRGDTVAAVLSVRALDDVNGSTRRQITSFAR